MLSRQFPQRDLVVERFFRLGRRLRPREDTLQKLRHSTEIEVDDHLMMLHALPALYKTQVPHETIVTVAHASEATIPEHPWRMHSPTIPSNLDARTTQERGEI
jgi:hypothetical protein